MSNPTLEPKVKKLLELKRMREELDAEIQHIPSRKAIRSSRWK